VSSVAAHDNNKHVERRSDKVSRWISISGGVGVVTDMQALWQVEWRAAVFAGVMGGDGY